MNPIINLAREAVQKLIPYSSARHESIQPGMHLDANENPFWREDGLNRYPYPQPAILRQKLAQMYGVNVSQMMITRGSDEGIDLLVRVFCETARDAIVITPPTYGMYEVAAAIQGVDVKRILLNRKSGFALDKEHLLSEWRSSMKLIFLCSPNNPTGHLIPVTDIIALCEQLKNQAVIVVDEAYIEFSTAESLSRYVSNYPNLVVLRTLSKAFGLAGARLGSLIAHEDTIALLIKVIAPYPIPIPVEQVAMKALSAKNRRVVHLQIQTIRVEREKLKMFLETLSSVKCVYPSEANFLLVKVDNAKRWMLHCAEHDIVIRSREQMPGLDNCVRITIGTEKENEWLKEVLSHV